MNEKRLNLIKEALNDWKGGNLTELSTLYIIDSLINPVVIEMSEQECDFLRSRYKDNDKKRITLDISSNNNKKS